GGAGLEPENRRAQDLHRPAPHEQRGGDVNIEFLSTVAVIAPDPSASRELYVGALGLPLEGRGEGYHRSEQIGGCKSFGIWPLSEAAEACFGTPEWRRSVLCRSSASNSTLGTPRQWVLQSGSTVAAVGCDPCAGAAGISRRLKQVLS